MTLSCRRRHGKRTVNFGTELDGVEGGMDQPHISKRYPQNAEIVASRDEAYEKFRAAIAKAVPEYGEAEFNEHAMLWANKAIAEGAISIAEDRR
jgi:hypothetical protein